MTEQTDEILLADLLTCERPVWDALVAGDPQANARALTEDFLGVYPDGFSGRAAHAAQLDQGPTVIRYALSQARLLRLAPDLLLLAYRVDLLRPGNTADEAMYVSSIWRRMGDGWRNLFSQDTPAA